LSNFAIPSKVFGDVSFTLTAPNSPSGGVISYKSSNRKVATVSGNAVTIRGAGSTVITATQAASGNYAGASISATLAVAKAPQTIPSFDATDNVPFGSVLTLTNYNSSANLPVAYVVRSGPAKLAGRSLNINGVGTVVLAASQPGNSNYSAVPTITKTFTTVKADQALSFTLPATCNFVSGGKILLSALSSAKLPISYMSGDTNVLAIVKGNAVIKGRGTTTVTASQPGNANYKPATPITNTITIQ
jgi:hypothetical protein